MNEHEMGDDMGIVTSIIDALRKFGSPTERTAIQRQDEQLQGKHIIARRRRVSRSELGQASTFVATAEPEPETVVKDFRCFPFHVIAKRVPLGEYGFFKPVYISLQDAAENDWKPTSET